MLVGCVVRVWSLIWPKDSFCKYLVGFGGVVGACGICSKGVWPEDLQCRRLVLFNRFVGPCRLHSEVVVPRMAQGTIG